MITFRQFSSAAAILLLCGAAQASTVNVDFEGGSDVAYWTAPLYYGDQTYYESTVGIWRENGVDTQWQSYTDFGGSYGIPDDEITPAYWNNLSDSDPGADPFVTQKMTISRTDGGLFNLKRIGTGSTYEGLAASGVFVPEGGNHLDAIAAVLPILGPSVTATARKADGSEFTVQGTTKLPGNWLPDYDGYSFPAVFGSLDILFSSDALASLTELASLTLEVFSGVYPDPLSERLAAARTFFDLGAPTELLEGLDRCGFQDCSVAGLGEFYFYTDILGGRNDIRNVSIADFDIEFVGGPGSQPAPVPLPATALLLLGGIGALGAARLRRRA